MEQLADVKPDNAPDTRLPLRQKTPVEKASHETWRRNQNIFQDAVSINVDFALACGGTFPSYHQLRRLKYHGFLDYSVTEIFDATACETVAELHALSRPYFDERLAQLELEKKEILDLIEADENAGLLHPSLFLAYQDSKDADQLNREANGAKQRWNVRIPLKEPIPLEEKIRRYTTFKVVEKLTPGLGKELTDHEPDKPKLDALARRTSIVLGHNVDTGKAIASLQSEIAKSNVFLSPQEAKEGVELTALELGWLDYVDPQIKANYYRNLREATTPKKMETLEPKSRRLGKIACKNVHPDRISYYDRFSAGDNVNAWRVGSIFLRPETFGTLVVRGLPDDLRVDSRKTLEVAHWDNEKMLEYGKWLISLVETEAGDAFLNEKILERARLLKLGPGASQIARKSRFITMANYYTTLGIANSRRYKTFNNWGKPDFTEYLLALGTEIGRRPTEKDINNESRRDPTRPSTDIIQRVVGSLWSALEAAGYPNISNWGNEDYIQYGLDLIASNDGKIPAQKNLDKLSQIGYGPSASSIHIKYKGLKRYKKLVYDQHEALKKKNVVTGTYKPELCLMNDISSKVQHLGPSNASDCAKYTLAA